jgi:hypothetical protein
VEPGTPRTGLVPLSQDDKAAFTDGNEDTKGNRK